MKRALLIALAILALVSLPDTLLAHPFSIKCPRDGQSMWFDHQVGFGRDAYCWYSHQAYEEGEMVKHEAYISCE